MSNKYPECCGNCFHNKAVKEFGVLYGKPKEEYERFQSRSYCALRNIKISKPFYTYCDSYTHEKPLEDKDKARRFAGWVYTNGLPEEGVVRIPWHGNIEPLIHARVTCKICGRQVEKGIRINIGDNIELDFCTNRHYVEWWKTKHFDDEISPNDFGSPEDLIKIEIDKLDHSSSIALEGIYDILKEANEMFGGGKLKTAESSIDNLSTRLATLIRQNKIMTFPEGQTLRLFELVSRTLENYLDFADKLFGRSPLEDARMDLERELTYARSKLASKTVEEAMQVTVLINEAVKKYNLTVQNIKEGLTFDPVEIRMFWKLWPLLHMIIRLFPSDEYESLAVQLYGVVSEGLQSSGAIVHLKNIFEEIFPLKFN